MTLLQENTSQEKKHQAGPAFLVELDGECITPKQLYDARQLAKKSQRALLSVLEESSGLAPDDFVKALGKLMHYPVLNVLEMYDLKPDFELLSFADAGKLNCVALRDEQNALVLVCADPFDVDLPAKLDLLIQQPAHWFLAHSKDIAAFLAHHESGLRAMNNVDSLQANTEAGLEGVEDVSLKSISEDTSPVVKFVRSTLYDALKVGASDIHLETNQHGLRVKYRIDGVLSEVGGLPGMLQAEQAISRIKVMSELDIAERRICLLYTSRCV